MAAGVLVCDWVCILGLSFRLSLDLRLRQALQLRLCLGMFLHPGAHLVLQFSMDIAVLLSVGLYMCLGMSAVTLIGI